LATGRVERRLAAILAADVAGYSRLMGADEEGTHERLQGHLGQLVEPKIKEHRGSLTGTEMSSRPLLCPTPKHLPVSMRQTISNLCRPTQKRTARFRY
jgi:class 3 adenylate cyclase